ncbi:MAG: phosphotransferase [Desulfobacterales bacterium]|nr:phosphotransferase [Desulfobacterales bacterium]
MNTLKKKYHSYSIGLALDFSDQQLNRLVDLFNRHPGPSDSVLGGRGSICLTDVEGIGPVAVKHYFRGGIIRFFNKKRYRKWGKTRGQIEYEFLQTVRNIGVNSPEPIAYSYHGDPFYKAWLVTRKIDTHQSLAELSISNLEHACIVMENVIEQLFLLIKNSILHVDLHPGNVVIDAKSKVYFLDFDKARLYQGTRHHLVNRYASRWKRAVVKHHLPDMLWEMVDAKLREFIL